MIANDKTLPSKRWSHDGDGATGGSLVITQQLANEVLTAAYEKINNSSTFQYLGSFNRKQEEEKGEPRKKPILNRNATSKWIRIKPF